jgi:predicted Zn-dependent peptidase
MPVAVEPRVPRRRAGAFALAAAATLAGLGPTPTRGALAASSPAPAADPVRAVLPNGLVVLAEERRTADTVALQLTARAGSRDDGALPGASALTSRLLFQGTGRRPSETDLQRVAAQVGGTFGRSTGAELSLFASLVPAGEAAVAFDLVADVVIDPLLAEDALVRQRQIALQDLAQRRSNPETLIDDLFRETLFAGHPAGSPIIGTAESLGAITRAALLDYRARVWGAANAVLTVVGRIPAPAAIDLAQRYFGDLPPGAVVARPAMVPPGAVRTVRADVGQQQVQFRLGVPAPSLLAPDRYAMVVLNGLTGGPTGHLFRALRSERGLAYSAGSGAVTLTDTGAWYAGAGVDPQNLAPALEAVRAELIALREAPPPAGEVADVARRIAGAQALADEGNAARGARLASQELLGTESADEFVRRVRQVTPDDVLRVARVYLDFERATLVVVGPPGLTLPVPDTSPAPAAPPAPAPWRGK